MTDVNQPPQAVPQDHTLEVLCHLLGLTFLTGLPLGNIIGPLILWLWKREGNLSVDQHGKESLNFQISMTLYAFFAGLTMFIMIGFVLLPMVLLANVILTIIAGVEAGKGRFYRYPLTIRFFN